ncbi:hypothetical protein [Aurantimonas sp. Leaf443]|uniref:hypothetical protein n=1 Tax=Aurantimonas sp. Leaf443 TaxID=1736378 RepID=UPI0006F88CDB|nr:hypothetical protein [Aurantimonas sp. Leaf443]KQT82833.1 hypothetical protein ASG48_15210 [Aurantimonas sp. Leaf443]
MLQFVAPLDYASPDLTDSPSGRWRGAVERFEPLVGIEGWALAIDAPDEPVELELTVGGEAFALGVTFEPRPEIARTLGTETACGFRFGPEIYPRLARLAPHRRDLPVGVSIAGTDTALRSARGRAPSVGALVDEWRSAVLGAMAPAERRLGKGDRLLARLSALRMQAEPLRERPLRPLSDHDVGQIDAVFPASDGQVWLVGSMKRGIEPEFPAIVLDRQKFPSGMAVLPYERQDLPTSAVGFVGVMDTGWVPPPAMKDGFVYVGRQGQFYLRYGAHTRVLRADAFLAAFTQAQTVAPGGLGDAMAAILHSGSNWLPGNAAATGLAVEGGIDRLLMMPGFGCLAEGWAVSPAKRIETFHMRIGDCVLLADESATSFRPRADLQPVFGAGSVTARAGFSTVLRGALPSDAGGTPLLRIVHDDGTMAVQRVEPKLLRRLDIVGDGEEVLRLFPSLRCEPFYPDFLRTVRRTLRERTREPAALALAPASRVVILRLPGEVANLNLTFARLARQAATLEPGIGLAVVMDQGRARAEAMLRFEELWAAGGSRPLSLFSVSHEDDILAELPWILGSLGAERFVSVGRGLVLTPEGWGHAAQSLKRLGHAIDRFEIVDDAGNPDRVEGALSAACFGWSAPALLEWSLSAPRFLRGVFRDSGLPVSSRRDRAMPGAAMRVERIRASRLADMVDEDLLSLGGLRHDA